jgi:hypothetical protein
VLHVMTWLRHRLTAASARTDDARSWILPMKKRSTLLVAAPRSWQIARSGLCGLVGLLLVSCGETPPAPFDQGKGSYWSTDMSLVKVWYEYADPANSADRPPDFVIPRAYIKLALPNEWPTPRIVPDEVRHVTTLVLFLALDTGEALPVWANKGHDSGSVYRIDRRLYTYFNVNVSPTGRELNRFDRPPPRPGAWTPGAPVDDDGYVRVGSPNGLYSIHTCEKEWKPNPVQFCSYAARLTPKIHIRASFSDYRARGGLPYAERVLSVIKATICKYNDCTQ